MRQIILEVEDSVFEKFMGTVELCHGVDVVSTLDSVETKNDRDSCMVYAIQTLRENNVFRHYYDYTWIMMALNDGVLDDYDTFKSPQAFLDYLYEIGIDMLPTRYSLSLACSKTLGKYPNWVFLDVNKAGEILRRKNVVKQFLSAYGVAKRGMFNKFFYK